MASKGINSKYTEIDPSLLEKDLRKDLLCHFREIGILNKSGKKIVFGNGDKNTIRANCRFLRKKRFENNQLFLSRNLHLVPNFFASGQEIDVVNIQPKLVPIKSRSIESNVFRLATLLWSVPVSTGFGRRLRFLIVDQHNEKLIGVLALGDPVFNLRVRDDEISWNVVDRKERLVNMMNAFVLGAVPPYNAILGGKLVACLIRTQEIRNFFERQYGNAIGIISKKAKRPRLVCVTTTSAFGRSSIYNRLKLNGETFFQSLGYTSGYGHFHVPDEIFMGMRELLRSRRHKYYSNYDFGNGPNWKIRVIRAALDLLGLDQDILRHGTKREVFICRLACNADKVLRGEHSRPNYKGLMKVREVTEIAKERWIIPRAKRYPTYRSWRLRNTEKLFYDI